MIAIHQFVCNFSYSYICFDIESLEAVIIDSVKCDIDKYLDFLQTNQLQLNYILETHVHADHVTAAHSLLTFYPEAKIGLSAQANCIHQNLFLHDLDCLKLGTTCLNVLETQGHTNTCLTYQIDNHLFTGDCLLINGCGRTDFQSGDASLLFKSIKRIYQLFHEDTFIHPAHDYNGCHYSTLGEQKRKNTRINALTSEQSFIKKMSKLNLAKPKLIDIAIPANKICGANN